MNSSGLFSLISKYLIRDQLLPDFIAQFRSVYILNLASATTMRYPAIRRTYLAEYSISYRTGFQDLKREEMLAVIGGHVNEEVLLRNEYLAAENSILRSKIKGRLQLTNEERIRLAELGKLLGKKALGEVGPIFKPETILKWYRDLIAKKFDGTKNRRKGKKRGKKLVRPFARENSSWGYDRIVGALLNLGYKVSATAVANIMRRNGIPPVRGRDSKWAEFIRSHADVIAGCDFFTVEVITAQGLLTYFVLFFIIVGSREVHAAGVTLNPNQEWMKQVARNLTMDDVGFLKEIKYVLMDRDTKFCKSFRNLLETTGSDREVVQLPAKSHNLNTHAERWVLSIKSECLSRMVIFGEDALRRVLTEYLEHYHEERNHQGKNNVLLFPTETKEFRGRRRNRHRTHNRMPRTLGGLLKFYFKNAA